MISIKLNILYKESTILESIDMKKLIYHAEVNKKCNFGIISCNADNEEFLYLFRSQASYSTIENLLNLQLNSKNESGDHVEDFNLPDGTGNIRLRKTKPAQVQNPSFTSFLLETAKKTIEIKMFARITFWYVGNIVVGNPLSILKDNF